MHASLNLSPEDLGGLVASVLAQKGYEVTSLRLLDKTGKDISDDIVLVIIDHEVAPLSIRVTPDEDNEYDKIHSMLYPLDRQKSDADNPNNK